MKILLFSSLFPHEYEPTLGIFVENRLKHLVSSYSDVEVKVIAPVPYFPFKSTVFGRYGRAAAAPLVEKRNTIDIYHPRFFTVPKFGMRLNPQAMFKAALKTAKQLIKDGYDFDLIDAHYLYPDGVAAMMLAHVLDKPFTMTARGSDVTEVARHFPFARENILNAIKRSHRTITVSSSLRDELIEMGASADQVTVLRNGVDTKRYFELARNETREKLGLNGRVMIYAGWLIKRKRLDIVMEVAARIPDLTTIIVGDGPEHAALEQFVTDNGLQNRVLFLGQKEPQELPQYYSAADILLLPSDREGWANVLLEAQACGTPVVTRDVGAARDIVTNDDVGRVVVGDSPDDIAEAVQSLLDMNIDRATVCKHACQYSWDETSKGQYEIFKQAVK
jgi:glycosyltransferase involved in cell wall biosynthesis